MILTAHTDGASKGNPGPAALGYTIEKDGIILEEFCECIGEATNNVAEYRALIAAMKRLKALGACVVRIFTDSELVVRQVTGKYKVKNPGLLHLHSEVMERSAEFDSFQISHIPRDRNSIADSLANKAFKKY